MGTELASVSVRVIPAVSLLCKPACVTFVPTVMKGSNHVYYKELALVAPDTARDLAISTDQPAFISADERRLRSCVDCESSFSPLVYAVGATVTAQHFHRTETRYESGGGGIYLWSSDIEAMQTRLKIRDRFKWIALVDPLGDREEHDGGSYANVLRAEAVDVRRIFTISSAGAPIAQGELVDSYDPHMGLYSRPSGEGFPFPDRPPMYTFYTETNGMISFRPASD